MGWLGGGGGGGGRGWSRHDRSGRHSAHELYEYAPVHDTKLFIIRLGYLLSESNVSELLVPAHNRAG